MFSRLAFRRKSLRDLQASKAVVWQALQYVAGTFQISLCERLNNSTRVHGSVRNSKVHEWQPFRKRSTSFAARPDSIPRQKLPRFTVDWGWIWNVYYSRPSRK